MDVDPGMLALKEAARQSMKNRTTEQLYGLLDALYDASDKEYVHQVRQWILDELEQRQS